MEKFQPTVEQRIEATFGPEMIEETAKISKQIFEAMKIHLANVTISEGSSTEQRKKADEYLSALRNFSNYFFAQETAVNLNPENVKTAIEGAVAVLSPETAKEYEMGAKNMVDKLQQRYGRTS